MMNLKKKNFVFLNLDLEKDVNTQDWHLYDNFILWSDVTVSLVKLLMWINESS